MNILNRKLCSSIAQKLTFTPAYQAYIHLQDHDKKVNPKATRLALSYMDPKGRPEDVPANPQYSAKLRKSAESQLRKRMFEQYKQKILQGKVDEEQVVEPDQLWGDQEIPVHYYRFLSATQVSTLSHSIVKDVEHYHKQLVKDYIESSIKTTDIAAVTQINQYAQVAAYYRYNNILDREKYFEIQKKIGNKFHLLTDKSLILLKYAFNTTPKRSVPEFNKILNDLLYESLGKLATTDLVHLLYFNKFDLYRQHRGNLQISVLEELTRRFKEFNLEQKIDFLFLYVESRSPTIKRHGHDRYHNEIRNRAQEIIYHLDLEGDFASLPELSILKLAYSLVRVKTNVTEHLTLSICQYVEANIETISAQNLVLFFIYLNKAQSNKSIQNLDLMRNLKQKVIANWESYSNLDKIRAIDVMYNLNLYDEAVHQLYTGVPIEADNTILAYFCRLEMMNTSGREWEVIHKLVELDYLPFLHFQDYKRFYNYVSVTAPDWKLTPLFDKLENTEIFYDALRLDTLSRDKRTFKGIRQFQEFSSQKIMPKPFKIATAVKNVQFAEFSLPQYQICVDIISDVERIKGTRDLKGSYQTKIKNLQCIGWKQLYVFQEDIQKLTPLEFFDYIYSVCEPHFEQQLKVIASYEEYRSYQIEQMRFNKNKAMLKMRELELFEVVKDFDLVDDEHTLRNQDINNIKEGVDLEHEMKQKLSQPGNVGSSV